MLRSFVKLAVAGAEYGDWYSVDIDSDIFTPADAFHVEARIPSDPEFLDVFREGVAADVYIDDDRQMAGVIDEVTFRSDPQRGMVSIDGRDLGAYLTDAEAKHIKAQNYTLKTLVEQLLQPQWGIRGVKISNEDNRKLLLGKKDKQSKAGRGTPGIFGDLPRAQTKIDPGTRIADMLDLRTRQLGVAWWMTADGYVFIGKPNYNQTPSYEFRCYAAGNPKAATNNCSIQLTRSIGERYSSLAMVGQGEAPAGGGGLFASTPSSSGGKKLKGSATDPDLQARGIPRSLIVVDHDALSNDEVQKHADEDMQRRRLNGLKLTVTYPSLRYEENARLFAVDTLAHVVFEEARIDDTFYVVARRNVVTPDSDQTVLRLVQKGVWLP